MPSLISQAARQVVWGRLFAPVHWSTARSLNNSRVEEVGGSNWTLPMSVRQLMVDEDQQPGLREASFAGRFGLAGPGERSWINHDVADSKPRRMVFMIADSTLCFSGNDLFRHRARASRSTSIVSLDTKGGRRGRTTTASDLNLPARPSKAAPEYRPRPCAGFRNYHRCSATSRGKCYHVRKHQPRRVARRPALRM